MKIIPLRSINSYKDLPELHFLPPKNWRTFKEHDVPYCDVICAFDVETTQIEPEPGNKQSFMYVWQFAIGTEFVIIGRTWEEFLSLVDMLWQRSNGNQIVCFVHNLSYEFQFLSGIWNFDNEEVFVTEPRKILKATLGVLEFRCSYLLTNLSLKDLTRRYGVEHGKLSGEEFDYTQTRYPWTELTERETEYIVNDVIGLIEAVQILMGLYGDDLYSLPLTSTGFIRRICRERMRECKAQVLKCYPSYRLFTDLRREFRGGNTHASRFFAGDVLIGGSSSVVDENIYSYDISSSYPSAMVNGLFPVSEFQEIKPLSLQRIEEKITHGRAVLFTVEVFDIRLRNKQNTPVPYIAYAKCAECRGWQNDNGRVLKAEYILMTVNDIDWSIIVEQYTFKAKAVRGWYSSYGKLPQPLIDANIEFFKLKTELKGVDGQELYYAKNKELLNSIYGMAVQNPAKSLILFDNCEYNEDMTLTEAQLLAKAKKRAFTLYQWGCWCTSIARKNLQYGIDLCGVDRFVYCDTDSIKAIGRVDFSEYNEKQKQLSLASGLHATDPKGVEHYGGVYEFDGEYQNFITLGAKKYAYTDTDGKIHVTVSGVGKKRGAAALTEAGGLDAFKPGFVFHNCGKTRSIYNDNGYGVVYIDGHELDITRNVVIEEQDYTLSITEDYDSVLTEAKAFLYKAMEIRKNNRI